MKLKKIALKLACATAIAGGIASAAMPANALDYILSGQFNAPAAPPDPGSSGVVTGTLSVVDIGGGNAQIDWTINISAGQSANGTAMGPTTYTQSFVQPLAGQQIIDTTTVGGAPPEAGDYLLQTNLFDTWADLATVSTTYFWAGQESNTTTAVTRFSGTTPPSNVLLITPVPFEFSPAMGLVAVGGLFAADQLRRKMKKGSSVNLGNNEVTA
jgi:hypothetical protein